MTEAFKQQQKEYWQTLLQQLFPGGLPKKDAQWTYTEDILYVLNRIASQPTGNQIYTPEGGWANLGRSYASADPGCIVLGFTMPKLIRPRMLIFENVGGDILWNYFRIVTYVQPPSGAYPKEYYSEKGQFSETVYQVVPPVSYTACKDQYDRDWYNKEPKISQELKRYYGGGDFVIASPASPLNKLTLNDPTLHQRKGDTGFRDYVRELVAQERVVQN